MSVIINTRFGSVLNARVREWAAANELTISQAMRMLVEDKLNDLSKETPAEEAWRRTVIREVKLAEAEKTRKAFQLMINSGE